MSSARAPYLIRAMYEWIADNGYTPHLLVNALAEDVVVPVDHVEDGHITLNVSLTAVKDLELGNDRISFNARFGGQPMSLSFPPSAVIAIYARENGEGMMFQSDDELQAAEVERVSSDGHDANDGNDGDGDDDPPRPDGPPKLRVVK